MYHAGKHRKNPAQAPESLYNTWIIPITRQSYAPESCWPGARFQAFNVRRGDGSKPPGRKSPRAYQRKSRQPDRIHSFKYTIGCRKMAICASRWLARSLIRMIYTAKHFSSVREPIFSWLNSHETAPQAARMVRASSQAGPGTCISQNRMLYSLTAVSCEAALQAQQ